MTQLFILVLNMGITASIAAAAVLLVRLLLRKAPKIFSYALWGVVFLRLICPFSLEAPVSLMPANNRTIPVTIAVSQLPQINSGIPAVDNTVNSLLNRTVPQEFSSGARQEELKGGSLPLKTVLSVCSRLWLGGTAVFLLYFAVAYIRIRRRIFDATIITGRIYESDRISTAFVLGFLRPKIYVPVGLRGKHRDFILSHERVHIKRLDYLIKPIAFFLLAIHWFNPILWISFFLMARDMELSCDEAVLRKSDTDIRQDYSISLVTLNAPHPGLFAPLAFCGGSMKNMKVRISNVLNFKKISKLKLVFCFSFTALFTAAFVTSPVSASVPPVTADKSAVADSQNTYKKTDGKTEKERKPYQETYSKNPSSSIAAYSLTNTWASSDTAGGDTAEEILDNKLAFIESIWNSRKEAFHFVEGISEDELTNMEGLQYMYDNSSIYRDLLEAGEDLFVRPECSFGLLGEEGNSPVFERHAFYLAEPAELSLSALYETKTGRISLIVVSPSGKIEYQSEYTDKLDEVITLNLEQGISSIIVAYETESNLCEGTISISGTLSRS